jgi:hypothetical protein
MCAFLPGSWDGEKAISSLGSGHAEVVAMKKLRRSIENKMKEARIASRASKSSCVCVNPIRRQRMFNRKTQSTNAISILGFAGFDKRSPYCGDALWTTNTANYRLGYVGTA